MAADHPEGSVRIVTRRATADIQLKAGRPNWDEEFHEVSQYYGKSDIGVVFCGAPLIAAALKEACEKHSHTGKTMFRLHKENF